MPWLGLTFELTLFLAGCGFCALGLAFRSPIVKRIKIAEKVFDVTLREALPARTRIHDSWIFLGAAVVFFAYPLAISLNDDRRAFQALVLFGAVLMAMRLFFTFSQETKLVLIDVTFSKVPEKNLPNLLRSPFILGGAAAMAIGGIPFLADHAYLAPACSRHYQQTSIAPIIAKVASPGFQQAYEERTVYYVWEETPHREDIFARYVSAPGHRVILTGRAGAGKSWFLKKLVYTLQEDLGVQRVVLVEARDLEPDRSIAENVNRSCFPQAFWLSLPATRRVLSHAVVLVDGLDEAKARDLKRINRSIDRFAADFPQSSIVVATRPMPAEHLPSSFAREVQLQGLEGPTIDRAIAKLASRLSSRIVADLERKAINRGFVNLLLPAHMSVDRIDWSNSQLVRKLFVAFLTTYQFDRRRPDGGPYLFMETFRDISILEDIFYDAIFGSLRVLGDAHDYGRTQIYEYFIKSKIIKNYPLAHEEDWHLADQAIEQIAEACKCQQIDPITNEVSLVYDYSKGAFTPYAINDSNLHELLLRSDLLLKSEGERYAFQHRSIQEYFHGLTLKRNWDADPTWTAGFLADNRCFSDSQILPFLVGHFSDLSVFAPLYLSTMRTRMTPAEIDAYLSDSMDEFMLHVRPTWANVEYLRKVAEGDATEPPPPIFQARAEQYLLNLAK